MRRINNTQERLKHLPVLEKPRNRRMGGCSLILTETPCWRISHFQRQTTHQYLPSCLFKTHVFLEGLTLNISFKFRKESVHTERPDPGKLAVCHLALHLFLQSFANKLSVDTGPARGGGAGRSFRHRRENPEPRICRVPANRDARPSEVGIQILIITRQSCAMTNPKT